jgi:protein disulfide-isomerase A6
VATLDGKLLETYQGERTAVAVAKWGMKVANAEVAKRLSGGGGGSKSGGAKPPPSEPGAGKAVVTLSESNFDKKVVSDSAPWMVEFYAPWCGHCKQLAPEWASAAEALAPRGVKLGAVDCTANEALCSRFGVSGYPSILVFGRDKSAHSPYEGPRTSAGVQAFAARLLETDGAPPEVPQLLGSEGYAAACTASGRQACVLAFLPHILDSSASARNRTLATLIKSAGAFAGRPWGWAWLEAAAQPELERALGVSQFPAVAMLNANKQVSSLMRASLSADNVKDFLNTLPGAAPVTLPAQELLATTQPWDGKDAEVPEMVDEFSLDEL